MKNILQRVFKGIGAFFALVLLSIIALFMFIFKTEMGIFKLAALVIFLVGGSIMTWTGLTNRTLIHITATALAKKKPGGAWFEITHARLKLSDPEFVLDANASFKANEVYIPIMPQGGDPALPIPAFLHSKKPEYLREPMKVIDDLADTTITGIVESGDKNSERAMRRFKERNKVADKFLLIEDGGEPHLIYGFSLLTLGILWLGWLTKSYISQKTKFPAASSVPPVPPAPPAPQSQSL